MGATHLANQLLYGFFLFKPILIFQSHYLNLLREDVNANKAMRWRRVLLEIDFLLVLEIKQINLKGVLRTGSHEGIKLCLVGCFQSWGKMIVICEPMIYVFFCYTGRLVRWVRIALLLVIAFNPV